MPLKKDLRAAGIIVCLTEDEKFLIIRRSHTDPHDRGGQWTFPGGHIDDEDDTIGDGAIRELKEETDLNCKLEDLVELGEPKIAKYYFLTLKWTGKINVLIPNPISGIIEHDDYKWASIKDIKELENTEIPIYLLEKALEMSKNE